MPYSTIEWNIVSVLHITAIKHSIIINIYLCCIYVSLAYLEQNMCGGKCEWIKQFIIIIHLNIQSYLESGMELNIECMWVSYGCTLYKSYAIEIYVRYFTHKGSGMGCRIPTACFHVTCSLNASSYVISKMKINELALTKAFTLCKVFGCLYICDSIPILIRFINFPSSKAINQNFRWISLLPINYL